MSSPPISTAAHDTLERGALLRVGTGSPHPVAPQWVTSGEYSLAPRWRAWALQSLGISGERVVADLFAKDSNTASPLFITKGLDSFHFSWAALAPLEDDVLWANPPFSILERVLAKASSEACRVILCCPVWPDAKWWAVLQAMEVARVLLPENESLFYGVVKKEILPPPKWGVLVCVLDSRVRPGPPPRPKVKSWLAAHTGNLGLSELQAFLRGRRGKEKITTLVEVSGSIPESPHASSKLVVDPPCPQEEGGAALPAVGPDHPSPPSSILLSGQGVRVVEKKPLPFPRCEVHLR